MSNACETEQENGTANSQVNQMVADVSGLVSPPLICLKILDLVESPESSAEEIGDVIVNDPNLTSRLLKLVNSAYYNFPSRIDTVSRAVAIVGTHELYSLVLAISAVNSFNKISSSLVNMDTFWRHSLFTGLLSRILAKKFNVLHPERFFIAGLLHDLGCLVLYKSAPDTARELLLIADGNEEIFYQAEVEQLGFSHADIGSVIMREWRMTETLQDAIRCHHRPHLSEIASLEACIVHVADVLANRSELGSFSETHSEDVYFDPAVWSILGIEEEELDVDGLMGEAGLQFAETVSVMFS